MVNPLRPSDDQDSLMGADLSGLSQAGGNKGVKANSSEESEKAVAGSFGEYSRVANARQSLMELLDNLTTSAPGGTRGARASTATGGTTGPGGVSSAQQTPEEQFNAAKQNAEAANTEFQSADTPEKAQAAINKMELALDEMKKINTGNPPPSIPNADQDIQAIEQKLTANQASMKQIEEMKGYADEMSQLLSQMSTAQSSDVVNNILVKMDAISASASQLLSNVGNSPHPAISAEKAKVDANYASGKSVATATETALKAAEAAEEQYKKTAANPTPNTIEKATEFAKEQLKVVEKLLADNPSNTVISNAKDRIEQVIKDLEGLQDQYDDMMSGILAESTGTTVGAAQNRQQTIAQGRIAMLLSAADSQTASIIMGGFRKMLNQFQEDNDGVSISNAMEDVLQKVEEEIGAAASADVAEEMKSLQGGLATEDGQATAMGAISEAMAMMGGAGVGSAATIGSAMKGVTFASSSSGKSTEGLSRGYDAYKDLNRSLSSVSDRETRDTISRTASKALERPLLRPEAKRSAETAISRDSSGLNQVMAKTMLSHTDSLGSLYGALDAYGSLSALVSRDPGISVGEAKRILTKQITEAPKMGYPHKQISDDAALKLIDQLTEEFVEGTKQDLEKALNQFKSQPAFVLQFLASVASFYV